MPRSHSIAGAAKCIFGAYPVPANATPSMLGFVDVESKHGGAASGPSVMRCFNATSVPVIATLATEFTLFDRWYSSVPGPTEVNRAYLHSATSHGMGFNNMDILIPGLPQDTLYDLFDRANVSYNFFMGDFSTYLFFAHARGAPQRDAFRPMMDFDLRAAAGTLPQFSFIDPRYFTLKDLPANDQHPDHNVEAGEQLIARVYDALRSSPQWNETLLVLTYDEHGGFYDHVPPPMTNVPNPDGLDSVSPGSEFKFDRLGVRVPTIMVSPWLRRGTVVHEPAVNHFDHTSLIATMRKLFNLGGPLTKRDAWAATFEHLWDAPETSLAEPRTDCPLKMPRTVTPAINKLRTTHFDGTLPINDLQLSMLHSAAGLHGLNLTKEMLQDVNEHDAGMFITKLVAKFIGRPVEDFIKG